MSVAAYCSDCRELTTVIDDQAKGLRLEGSSNHFGHNIEGFGDLTKLTGPIFNVVARLGALLPINDNAITMFRLGLDLTGYPTGSQEDECLALQSTALAAGNDLLSTPAPALESDAFTRSQPASTPSSATGADIQLALFGGVA